MVAVFVLVFVLIGVVYIGSSHAATTSLVCNGNNQCVDASGGRVTSGTPILGWPKNYADGAQHFTMGKVYICGVGGTPVGTVGENCPFNSTALSVRYYGDEIDAIQDTNNPQMCVAADSQLSYQVAALEPCGATGYLFVRNTVPGKGLAGYVENVAWSNNANSPRWLCLVPGAGNQLYIDSGDWGAACRWFSR
jgi:hypothetical protein